MPIASVPSPNAGAAGAGRAYLTEMILGRVVPAVLMSIFVADQLVLLADAAGPFRDRSASLSDWLTVLNRLLTLAFFTLMVVLYVTRLPARGGDRRPLVVLVAMVGSYSILAGSFLPGNPHGQAWVLTSDVVIPIGVALALWSLAHLRRSFSIIPEARRLVTGGPYAVSRNPLYLGELIAGIGVLLPGFGPVQAGVLAVFVSCQLLRISWEERVLAAQFPTEFSAYRTRVPRLIPLPVPTRRGNG